MTTLAASLDRSLDAAARGTPRVPGVAAVVTGRGGVTYRGASGVRTLASPDGPAMTTDTVCALFSATKALTGTACLQLVDDGRLDLDTPAKRYAPALGDVAVLEGFEGGQPVTRPPKRDVTTRMLLLHTSGFGYDIFNERYHRLEVDHGQPRVSTCTRASLSAPLLFDPGERWEYGIGVDWAGQVVEGITGRRLGEVLAERVLGPLGMRDTAFGVTPRLRPRLAPIYQRGDDGSLTPTGFEYPADPEVDMGGHGLYSTAEDYARFLRMWLDDGRGPDGPVLAAGTVAMAEQNGLGDLRVRPLPGVIPSLAHDAELFPGLSKSWGLTFMINDEDAPTGRRAGSLSWCGLANVFYWIDRRSGVAGVWMTQVLPFFDPTSLEAYLTFETAVYDHVDEAATGASETTAPIL